MILEIIERGKVAQPAEGLMLAEDIRLQIRAHIKAQKSENETGP